MDDFEDSRVRRARGLNRATWDDNIIPPEKRGKVKCAACVGQCGTYALHVFTLCPTCQGRGELP